MTIRAIRYLCRDNERSSWLLTHESLYRDPPHPEAHSCTVYRGDLPATGLVQQVSPSLCQTLELGLNLLLVLSVRRGCDPRSLSTDHLHRRPAII